MRLERTFDARVWKTGHALVITIPSTIVKKFKIKEKGMLEMTLRR